MNKDNSKEAGRKEPWAEDVSQHLDKLQGNSTSPASTGPSSVGAKRARPGRGQLAITTNVKEVSRSLTQGLKNNETYLRKSVMLLEKLHRLSEAEKAKDEANEGQVGKIITEDVKEELKSEMRELDDKIKGMEESLLQLYEKRRGLNEKAGRRLPQDGPKYAGIVMCHSLHKREAVFATGCTGEDPLTTEQDEDVQFASQILIHRHSLSPPANAYRLKKKAPKLIKDGWSGK